MDDGARALGELAQAVGTLAIAVAENQRTMTAILARLEAAQGNLGQLNRAARQVGETNLNYGGPGS